MFSCKKDGKKRNKKNNNSKNFLIVLIILIIGITVAIFLRQTILQQSPQFSPITTPTKTYSTPKPTLTVNPGYITLYEESDIYGDCKRDTNPSCSPNDCNSRTDTRNPDGTITTVYRNGYCYFASAEECKCNALSGEDIARTVVIGADGHHISDTGTIR